MKAGSVHRILSMKFMSSFLKFAVVGVLNTAVTYGIFLLLLQMISYLWAYSIAYASGVLFSFIMNSKFVFQKAMTLKKLLVYPIVYLIQYGINTLVLYIVVTEFGINPRIALLVAIVITIPITYLLSRRILGGRKSRVE